MARSRVSAVARLAALVALALAPGCGASGTPSATSSSEEATVKGTVKVLGKPATDGKLTFDPSNVNRPNAPVRTVTIGKDGTYEVKTLVGPNSVSVNLPRTGKPVRGMSPELGIDVKSGGTTFDIELPVTGD